MQEHNHMPAKNQNLDLLDNTLRILQDIRGYVSAGEFYNLLALMLCFSDKGMLDDHCRYVPDPSNKNCYFLSEIWNVLSPSWERFIANAGEERVRDLVDVIRQRKYSPSEKLQMLNNYNLSSSARSDAFYTQPQAITQLGIGLLNYQGGTVYNPFAGTASYGLALKVGDKYHGEEYNPETWAVGQIKLLFAKNPSRHYTVGNSFHRIKAEIVVDGYHSDTFNYVISTPPFGMRVPENRSMVTEEILLNNTEQLLSPLGTMVMFALATITTKGGRVREIRQRLTESNLIDTVIALPREAFNPVTSVATVALILKTNRDDLPVKFLDARDCLENKVLKVSEILKRLGDPNSIHEITHEQIREHDYSWHPSKYEEPFSEEPKEGFERIQLRDILTQTGRSTAVSGFQRYLSVSDLSSDPYAFRKSINDIGEKNNMDSRSMENIARLREESLMSIQNLEEEKRSLQGHIKDDQDDIITLKSRLADVRDVAGITTQKEIEKLERELDLLNKQHNDVVELYKKELSMSSDSGDTDNAFLDSLREKTERIEEKLLNLENSLACKKDELEAEIELRVQLDEAELKRFDDAIKNNQHRIREIDEQIDTIRKRLEHTTRNLEEQDYRELIKVVQPSLFLGGKKPRVKFTYIEDVSSESPIYLTNKSVSAFLVDTSRVDLDYLVYVLSTIDFKDYGEMVPMIPASEILDISIDILPSIYDQKAFVDEARAISDPYYRKIEDIKQQYLAQIESERLAHQESEAKLLASLGSKQHDLGNLCPKITLKFADLYDAVTALPDTVSEKQALIKQIEIISAEMKDMNNVIAIISEREDFPIASKVDIIQFFNEYIDSHPGNGYYIEPLHYDKTEIDALEDSIFVDANDIALTRAILNIRENAEMHGFNPDNRGIRHFMSVSISVNRDMNTCTIDFSNNGLPMPEGMDDKRYGTKGEKAGDTGHTGNGGWYISEMAKFYGGSYHVNPADADSDLVTIRLTLPLSHE